ncbi:FAD-binding oxidoreductase [Acuticoccus sp. M5D2P5]|uniref:FAD-binding oxidoreductase n=1 Tax=Acuticoccus kalidii TaxID=2910977 RepID=UPI001F28BD28|nr:FAD-binding oxidoreductase [Acuticoccus kalidii]MCF3933129.1 FAD-binding oxidoreductase [Acuticoccus kalidii]
MDDQFKPRFMSWGRPGRGDPSKAIPAAIFPNVRGPVLPFGAGRSYGDSCTLTGGHLIDSRERALIRQFDPHLGRLVADAGVSIGTILRLIGPRYTLSTIPGTRHVTLGGAIANDIYGRNHHRRGSFGSGVEAITLRRSDQPGRLNLRPGDPLFDATLGGMGMTGLIERVTIKCQRVPSNMITRSTIPFTSLAEGLALVEEGAGAHEYVSAWVDGLATGALLGRGKLVVGDHAVGRAPPPHRRRRPFRVRFTPPFSVVGPLALRAFNVFQQRGLPPGGTTEVLDYENFFFALDKVGDWNRLYGPRGLHQHQSVIPAANALDAMTQMLKATHRRREYSSFAALGIFGLSRSPGLIGFSRPGLSLLLDFPDRGRSTLELLKELDAIALSAGGAVNPYKTRQMGPEAFDRSMPNWRHVEALRDPLIMSDFWRRNAYGRGGPAAINRAA